MSSYLLVWNPKKSDWHEIEREERKVQTGRRLTISWSCGNRKNMLIGSRVFLVRVGQNPKGLIASGRTVCEPYKEGRKKSLFVEFRADALSVDPILTVEHLQSAIGTEFNWTPEGSGIEIPTDIANDLERLWSKNRLPDAARYAEALRKISGRVNAAQKALLVSHYHCLNRTATARVLAAKTGMSGFEAVNLIYGRLGALLRRALAFKGDGQQSQVLASFYPPNKRHGEWRCVMHAQLAMALEELGWVEKKRGPSRLKSPLRSDTERGPGRLQTAAGLSQTRTLQAIEGLRTEAARFTVKRSAALRQAALDRANGVCEACATDFSKILNGRGLQVLQVHHRKQLAALSMPRVNSIDDLAVVCANCHTLIHSNRKKAMKVEELRRLHKVSVKGNR